MLGNLDLNYNTDMYADASPIHISGKNISDIQTKVQYNRIMVQG